jgi:hypothetical protein
MRNTSMPLSTGMSRIQQHDVRIRGADRLQRAQAVGSFKHGSAAEVGQHSAREAPHVRIIVDHQDIQTLELFSICLLAMKPRTVARIAQQSTLELGLFVENDRSNFSNLPCPCQMHRLNRERTRDARVQPGLQGIYL